MCAWHAHMRFFFFSFSLFFSPSFVRFLPFVIFMWRGHFALQPVDHTKCYAKHKRAHKLTLGNFNRRFFNNARRNGYGTHFMQITFLRNTFECAIVTCELKIFKFQLQLTFLKWQCNFSHTFLPSNGNQIVRHGDRKKKSAKTETKTCKVMFSAKDYNDTNSYDFKWYRNDGKSNPK